MMAFGIDVIDGLTLMKEKSCVNRAFKMRL